MWLSSKVMRLTLALFTAGCCAVSPVDEPKDLRLTLGVVSDIHVDSLPGDRGKSGDTAVFEKALRWFDEQGVDGVVVAGDMADNGLIAQLEKVGAAWFRVFPDGRSARDGRKVEPLFIYGNHDYEGWRYDDFDKQFPDPAAFKALQIRSDPAKVWKDVFREDYAPIWMKEVKGYQVIGAHWKFGANAWDGTPRVEKWFKENADKIDRTKPFFFIQHPHPQGTVYGAHPSCSDKGYATRALSAFPNAIAISGHSHVSLTNPATLWRGAFTSIGAASLRYGYEPDKCHVDQREGMLIRVYGNSLVIERRDFVRDRRLGEDWVLEF